MDSIKITFKNKAGNKLSAVLEYPIKQKPIAFAVFAHCFSCNKNFKAVRNITQLLKAKGIGIMRFDFTGLGESGGHFEDSGFVSNMDDLESAVEFLSGQETAPLLVIGHSLGGTAALFTAGKLDAVKALVTLSAPYDPEHVIRLIDKKELDALEQQGSATVSIGGRHFRLNKAFIDELKNRKPKEVIHGLKRPLLILHSPFDKIVGIDNAAKIFQAALHPKSFISLDHADHLLSRKEDSYYAGEVIAAWSKKYIGQGQGELFKSEKKVLARTPEQGYTTDIMAGKHRLTSDEPENGGGDDFGPNPYELLSAGLGACTAMTLQLYARKKKWPLKEALVHLEHNKVHAQDCQDCDEKQGDKKHRIDVFKRSLELKGDLTQEQKEKMISIADKCPVSRTLKSEVKIETDLYKGD